MQSRFKAENFNTSSPGNISRKFDNILDSSSDAEKAEFLRALHHRGESADEVAELAALLRKRATLSPIKGVSDIVGTGGDGLNTINVSTASSIVLSSMGVKIAKHGNFGATSNKGSADFLKYIGYNFEMNQRELDRRLRTASFAFILAPRFNSSFAKFANARKMLPFKTIFNYLGPLTNPADPSNLTLGTTNKKISDLYTDYLVLNSKSGCVIHSDDGMDEISPNTISNVNIIKDGKVETTRFNPKRILGKMIDIEEISRIEARESFELTLAGLNGKNDPASQFISLNSAIALHVNGVFSSIEEAFSESMGLIRSGYVFEHIDRLIEDCGKET